MNVSDPTGECPWCLALATPQGRAALGGAIGAVVGAVVNVVDQATTGDGNINVNQVLNAAAAGFITGAAIATTGNPAVISGVGAVATGAASLGNDIESGALQENPSKSLGKAGVAAVIGGVTVPAGAALGQGTVNVVDDIVVAVVAEVATVKLVEVFVGGADNPDQQNQQDSSSQEPPKASPCPTGGDNVSCSP